MVLVDADRLLFNDLKVLHLSSRQVDRIGEGSLVGRNANGVAGQVCDSTGCTVSVYNWAGDTLASARLATSALSNEKQSADSTTGRVGNLRAGLLNPDGRFLVFGWLGKVTEPGEVRRLDFTTGQTATLFRQDGFPQAAALTNDGGSALVSVDSRTGSFRLISLADPTRTATAELGANVLTITAGPSMQPR